MKWFALALILMVSSGCFRQQEYVLNLGQRWRIAYPVEVPLTFVDPTTGKGVIYWYTFPANSMITGPMD